MELSQRFTFRIPADRTFRFGGAIVHLVGQTVAVDGVDHTVTDVTVGDRGAWIDVTVERPVSPPVRQ